MSINNNNNSMQQQQQHNSNNYPVRGKVTRLPNK